ncbi:UDP-N-acetylmuramoyl-L-alanine--D-glutamate ligase [Thermoproteota archaeon]
MAITKISVLGAGITACAVRKKIKELGIKEVPLSEAELIVTSPGIPKEKLPCTKTEIISEIEFAYRLFIQYNTLPKLIGITGTNGKTTVTALTAHILSIPSSGNIGDPLINYVSKHRLYQAVAVELSSYQLEFCSRFTPHIAVLLNLTPDHLERHKTMDEYYNQKAKLIQNQSKNDYVIYNADCAFVKKMVDHSLAKKIPLTANAEAKSLLKDSPLKGDHNIINALAAFQAGMIINDNSNQNLEQIKRFKTLEHRIEYVGCFQERQIYNDSKATNPESVIAAIHSFNEPVCLILGGKDKGLDLNSFLSALFDRVRVIAVFGEITDRFYNLARELNPYFPIYKYKYLSGALKKAIRESNKGDVILFSPACSSFDQFENYEHRGRVFKRMVKLLC